jgi:hypothetical protein
LDDLKVGLNLLRGVVFNRALAFVSRTMGKGSLKGRLEQNPSEGVVKSKRVHNFRVDKGRLGQNPAEGVA